MYLFRPLILTALLASCSLPLLAHAGAESGFYIGAGVGNSNIKGPIDEENYDAGSSGYKLIAGYNFGIVPLVDVAIEGSYADLGEETSGNITYAQTSLNGFGLLGLSFGPVGLFAKAGLAAWDADTTTANLNTTASGTEPVYGIGARLQILSFTGRVEYEYYDQDNIDDVSMASISLLYTF